MNLVHLVDIRFSSGTSLKCCIVGLHAPIVFTIKAESGSKLAPYSLDSHSIQLKILTELYIFSILHSTHSYFLPNYALQYSFDLVVYITLLADYVKLSKLVLMVK